MKRFSLATAVLAVSGLLSMGLAPPAHAIGCLSGGAVGAVAGHQVHHGVMGAVGGCVAGHYANKALKKRAAAQQQQQMYQQQPNNQQGGSGQRP